ncbi:MAG: hypothetical protein JOZ63_14655 [Planctomycetaceae bacterium]|nr:hypothetical protein [Planctomycetaceae bacterium]
MTTYATETLPSYPFPFGPFGTSTLAYDEFRRTTPVRRVSVPSGWEAWLVTRYSDVCMVHKDKRFSRDEAVRVGAALVENAGMEVEAGVLQNTDGEEHARLRRVFASHYGVGIANGQKPTLRLAGWLTP